MKEMKLPDGVLHTTREQLARNKTICVCYTLLLLICAMVVTQRTIAAPYPIPDVAPHGDARHCHGDTAAAIIFTGSVPGTIFKWTSSINVGFGTSGTGNIPSYIAINDDTVTRTAIVIVKPYAHHRWGVPDTFRITVKPNPIFYGVPNRAHCNGDAAPAIAFIGAFQGFTFKWSGTLDVGFGTRGIGDIYPYTAINNAPTPIVTTVTVTPKAKGCIGRPFTFNVTVNPTPNVDPHGDLFYCRGVSGDAIDFTGAVPFTTFAWTSSANVGFGLSGTGNIPPYTTLNHGSTDRLATVIVTPSAHGCPGAKDTFLITVKPKVSANDGTVCKGHSLDLTPLGIPTGGIWSGPGVSGNTFNSAGLATGTYKIYYNIAYGCPGYDSAYIAVTQCCAVYGTYTQGVYSSSYGTVCDGNGNRRTPVELINYLLSLGGQITVGRPGRSVIIPTYAAATVNAVLGGYGYYKLSVAGNVTISNTPGSPFAVNYLSGGMLKNCLLGQQIAMKLNVRMNHGLAYFPIRYTAGGDSYFQTFKANENCCKFTCGDTDPICFNVKNSVAAFLTKGGTQTATLADLINLADDLLGGVLTPGTNVCGYVVPSYADVENVLGTISSAFNYFRTYIGGYGCSAAKGAIASGNTTGNIAPLDAGPRIYPNPTTGAFNIEIAATAKDAHVTVVDINGRTILSATLPADPYAQKLQLEMPNVSRGMYFIRIEADGGVYTKKLWLE